MNKEQYKSFPRHWVTSDIHFGHVNIIKYQPEQRGHFNDVFQMNEEIVRRWNSTIGTEDHTFILGDVAMGDVTKAPGYLARMNGFKTLVLGNHDRSLMKLDGIKEHFVAVHDYLCFAPTKGTALVMMHYPISSWDGKNNGAVHLHGHLHGSPSGLKGRVFDVGMDTNDLYPYAMDDVVSMMKKVQLSDFDHHGDPV
jgi:calcineurin-like phosphoesterase family protein